MSNSSSSNPPSLFGTGAAGAPAQDGSEASYLADLNRPQREAVSAMDGPVLVLAGAGTGKTRVLTTRLAHILRSGRAAPHQVLAVTFTNKAAREMKARVEKLIGCPADNLWLGTFHALCVRILRRHAEAVGLKSNFTILDPDDQTRLLKQLIQAADIDEKRWPARGLRAIIERWKDKGLTPDRVSPADLGDFAMGRSLELYRQYQDRLKTLNAVDFGDLLLHCLTLFTEHGDILERYQKLFRYILVDEYQDTNVAQYLWLRLLARSHQNICCVGDDDQSIYRWRGAEVGNILRFEDDFPGARVVRLEQNYRSTPHILGAASGLIAQNDGRLGKTLWTERKEGDPVVVKGVWDGEEEARVISDEIESLRTAGHALNDMAILVRAGFQTREFEERFITIGLPYRVVGGLRFYERQEIRDAIAYFRAVISPDDDLAYERIINLPKRGIGDATVQTVHRLARAENISFSMAAGRLLETDELKPRSRTAVARFLDSLSRWRSQLPSLLHAELAETILDESGYTDMWARDKSPQAPGRLENLKELIHALEEFETLPAFLEHVSLVMENSENQAGDMVNVMTLHAAKGLEFDTVFLPGWEEGLFPHQRALDEGGVAALEEERRLAYVGLTRARKQAAISFAANRRIYDQWQSSLPSRFIDELPGEHVRFLSDQGLYGGPASPVGALAEDTDGFDYAPASGPGRYHAHLGASQSPGQLARARRAARDDARQKAFVGDERGIGVGQTVFHQKFGYGRVRSADGDKLEIDFEKAGIKKVMGSFVEPA